MTMMSAKEASSAWGISPRRITVLCSAGKISGAKKANRIWQIPADAEKPVAARIRSGAYRKSAVSTPLPLPVGISDYRLVSTEYYYVDKTLMIRDFLDQRPMVSLFTRPRCFGKTLNMDMLRVFSKRQMKIPPYTLRTRPSGLAGRSTGIIRENTQLSS